jgi:hypothetical protein
MPTDRPTSAVFAKALFSTFWTYLVIVGTLLTVLLVPRQWYWLVPIGVVIIIVLAAFRVVSQTRAESARRSASETETWGGRVSNLQSEIARRDQEIARLNVKPYDEAQRQAVQTKLVVYSYVERDLLRFLLQRGETVGALIYQHSQAGDAFSTLALERLTREGLLQMRTDMSNPMIEQPRFWRINAAFEPILRDLLYPRRETQATPAFLI